MTNIEKHNNRSDSIHSEHEHVPEHDHHHNHEHGHSGHGHHHHHNLNIDSLNKAFIIGIAINVIYVVVEAVFGFIYDSMSLLSDAGHNLSDVAALSISLIAFKIAQKAANQRYTYGYRKITVQASLTNAILLCIAVGAILLESINKISHPVAVDGDAIAWVAAIGVVINGITAWLFLSKKDKDLNVKGAFLHMAADALVSVGVVVSGIIIHFTGWYLIDPIVGIIIAIFIAISTKQLLVESFRMSLDAVPEGIDYNEVKQTIAATDNVSDVHHLHIWPLSTTVTAMTTHVIVNNPEVIDKVIQDIRESMATFNITHCTIEAESHKNHCECDNCLD